MKMCEVYDDNDNDDDEGQRTNCVQKSSFEHLVQISAIFFLSKCDLPVPSRHRWRVFKIFWNKGLALSQTGITAKKKNVENI